MIEVLGKFGFMAASKAVMALIGVDCGPVAVHTSPESDRRGALRRLARENGLTGSIRWVHDRGAVPTVISFIGIE